MMILASWSEKGLGFYTCINLYLFPSFYLFYYLYIMLAFSNYYMINNLISEPYTKNSSVCFCTFGYTLYAITSLAEWLKMLFWM